MIFLVETNASTPTLIAVLKLLTAHEAKPTRVKSKDLFGASRVLHRIETAPEPELDAENLLAALSALEGVFSAKLVSAEEAPK